MASTPPCLIERPTSRLCPYLFAALRADRLAVPGLTFELIWGRVRNRVPRPSIALPFHFMAGCPRYGFPFSNMEATRRGAGQSAKSVNPAFGALTRWTPSKGIKPPRKLHLSAI